VIAIAGNDEIAAHADDVIRVPSAHWMLAPLLAPDGQPGGPGARGAGRPPRCGHGRRRAISVCTSPRIRSGSSVS
jgi:hypothetical protein